MEGAGSTGIIDLTGLQEPQVGCAKTALPPATEEARPNSLETAETLVLAAPQAAKPHKRWHARAPDVVDLAGSPERGGGSRSGRSVAAAASAAASTAQPGGSRAIDLTGDSKDQNEPAWSPPAPTKRRRERDLEAVLRDVLHPRRPAEEASRRRQQEREPSHSQQQQQRQQQEPLLQQQQRQQRQREEDPAILAKEQRCDICFEDVAAAFMHRFGALHFAVVCCCLS